MPTREIKLMESGAVKQHCKEIARCNQRGGRMLSVVDLVETGTMSRDMAAYSLAAIGGGASFMVGAVPGGAGKTTVMGALLNFVPADVPLRPADGERALTRAGQTEGGRACYICHEIGAGPYYAYLWDALLRRYFRLPAAGHMLATNLHADTLQQAQAQICDDNGVPLAEFRRVNLFYGLRVGNGGRFCHRPRTYRTPHGLGCANDRRRARVSDCRPVASAWLPHVQR